MCFEADPAGEDSPFFKDQDKMDLETLFFQNHKRHFIWRASYHVYKPTVRDGARYGGVTPITDIKDSVEGQDQVYNGVEVEDAGAAEALTKCICDAAVEMKCTMRWEFGQNMEAYEKLC